MPPWFHMPHLPPVGASAALDAREARHATGARRLSVGDVICVFDGAGTIAHGTIRTVDKREVVLAITAHERQPEPTPAVHLAAALPKGDRQGVMLSMATQLGMRAFAPLVCERSIVKAGDSFMQRAERICIESCKQSRRAHLPVIHEPADVALLAARAKESGTPIVLAHPDGLPAQQWRSTVAGSGHVVVLIGPEGGFTEEEVAAARGAGATVASLGNSVLRVETAAVALLTLVMHG